MYRASFLALATLTGCTGDVFGTPTDANGSGDTPMATFTATTSFDGEPVDGIVDVYEQKNTGRDNDGNKEFEVAFDEKLFLTAGATNAELEVPLSTPLSGIIDTPLAVAAGDRDDERACNNSPLHFAEDGNALTYNATPLMPVEGENPTVDVVLSQYLLGWFECTTNTTPNGEAAVEPTSHVYDPLLVQMNGATIRTTCGEDGGNCFQGLGVRGTFSTSGSTLVLSEDNEYSIENNSSWAASVSFGYVFSNDDYRQEVSCEKIRTATCDE